ncbi:hypothetical protein BGZ80_005212, partial [Entomortierella chlamydospora]
FDMNDEQSSDLFEQSKSTGFNNEADDIEWLLGQFSSPNMVWDDSVLDLFPVPSDLDATTSAISYTLDAVSSIAPFATSEPEDLQKNCLGAGIHGVESRSISAIPGSVGDNDTPDLGATASCLTNIESLLFGADSSLDFGSIPIQSNLIDINTTGSIQDPKQITETNIFQEQEATPEVTVSPHDTANTIDLECLSLTKPHTHRLDGGGFIDINFSSVSINTPSQPPLLDEATTSSQSQITAQTLPSQEPSQYSKYPQLSDGLTTDKLLFELLSPHPDSFIAEANNMGSSSKKTSSRNISQKHESISKTADNDLSLSKKRKFDSGHTEQASKARKPSPRHASHSNPVPPVLTHVTPPQEALTYQQLPSQTMLSQQQLLLSQQSQYQQPQQSQYQQPQHQVHQRGQQPQENKAQQGQQRSQEQNPNTWLQLQQQQQLSQHVEWQLQEHQKIQLQAQLQIQQLRQQRQQLQQQLQLQYQQYQQYQQYLQLSQHQQRPQYQQCQHPQYQQYHQQPPQHQQLPQHQQQQHQQNQHRQWQKRPKSKEHKSKQQELDCQLHEQEICNNPEEEEEGDEEEEEKEEECEEEEEEEEREADGEREREREREEGDSSNTQNHDQGKKKKKKITDSSHHRARNAFFMFRGFASRLFAKEPDPVLLAAAAAAADDESISNKSSSRPSTVRKKMRQTSLSALAAKCWSFVCFKTCGKGGCANCRMHSVFDQSANFLKLRETELERLMMFSIEPGSQNSMGIGSEGSSSDVCTIYSKALLDTNPEEFFNWKEFEVLYKTCDQFKYFRENCLAPGEVMELEAFKQIWIKAEREHE